MKDKAQLSSANSLILDVLRIFAAQMVLFGHSFAYYKITVFQNEDYFPDIGSIGVLILFHLSGFLSIYSLEKNNHDNNYLFRDYFKHRVIRIYKGLVPALIFIAILDWISICINVGKYNYSEGFTVSNFIGNLLMLHNHPLLYGKVIPFGSGRPLWTLGIEWWQYMALGSIFLIIANKIKITYKEVIIYGGLSVTGILNFTKFDNVSLCFLFGVLIYYLYDKLDIKHKRFGLFSCMTLFVVGGIIIKDAYSIYIYIIIFLIVLICMSYGSKKQWKSNQIISFCARYTYMLFLTHYSIIDFIYHVEIAVSKEIKFVGGIVLSNVVAAIMYMIFEKRCRFQDWWYRVGNSNIKDK